MNAPLALAKTGGALGMPKADLIKVLGSSLYPGASPASIEMVLGYCQAADLDPMQKPVHIVPMWDSKAKAMRDVVMPGVNLYRTQAARSGAFAGMSEPEFGPAIKAKLGGVEIEYPDWARVSVKRRLATGEIVEFTAVEYWIENYAVKGGPEKSMAPNSMWMRRPRGQIAKCAQAQALRIAFPEIASQPTADEMEGKTIHVEEEAGQIIDACPAEYLEAARKSADGGRDAFGIYWKTLTPAERLYFQHEIDALKVRTEAAEQRLAAEREATADQAAVGTEARGPDTGAQGADPAQAEGQARVDLSGAPEVDPFVAALDRSEQQVEDAAPAAKGAKGGKR
jgi:phage recombination protein Bet